MITMKLKRRDQENMKILIDTNVILDCLMNRQDYVDNATKIFKLCETKKVKGYISALSIPNIIYILRKELDNFKIKKIIDTLSLIFEIIELSSEDLKNACLLNFNDYEDAIQSIHARKSKSNFIVTRNDKDFSNSTTPAIMPEKFLELIESIF